MSRERGVMSSEEADHVSPWEVTPTVGKGTLGTWRFPTSAWVAGLIKPVQSPDAVLETRLWANHGVRVYANQRLSLGEEGKALWRKSQDFKPDRGNPAVRHYRGATGNVAMVGMRTRLAIERAGTVTPHLKRGAPVLYPNPNGNGEKWLGRTYGTRRQSSTPPAGRWSYRSAIASRSVLTFCSMLRVAV